jgi:hypothetical protein
MTGMIILTQRAEKINMANYVDGDSWRFIPQARIVALDRDKPKKSLKVLSEDFYSACSPEISFDGKSMLFTGQRHQGDYWQIWEMNLENRALRQITTAKDNCIDPAYLPNNRLVFSKITTNDSLKAGFSLYTINLDGSKIQRISFNPNAYFASSVLTDGRILTISRQLFPERENPFWIVIRPDGTKAFMFYKGPENSLLYSRARETPGSRIVFAESDSMNQERGNLISIRYNQPMHSRVNLSSRIEGDFRSVFPQQSGKYLVSYRKSSADRYALCEFDPEKKTLGEPVYFDAGYDVLEAVVVEASKMPKKLPSEVDLDVKTGLILCQDINIIDPLFPGSSAQGKARRIEVLDLNASMGIITVEKDGSFYLKAMADKPFRIQTLDENGKVINGPCSWIWLRPNERRGCVGCHEDPELAPENNVPLSVRKSPVIIPVHISEVFEKEVELE